MNTEIAEIVLKQVVSELGNQLLPPPFEKWGVDPHEALDKKELTLWLRGKKQADISSYLNMPGFPKVKTGNTYSYPWVAVRRFLAEYNY